MPHPLLRLLFLGCVLLSPLSVNATEFHVAPTGNDTYPGTETQPFATLEKAREAIRKTPDQSDRPLLVKIHAGEYLLEKPLTFSREDSGTTRSTVIFQGPPSGEVRLTGAVPLAVSQFKKLTPDTSLWNNLDPSARENVLSCNLREAGISNYGAVNPIPFGAQEPAPLELFFNDTPMTLARWPNQGFAFSLGAPPNSSGQSFLYEGDQPTRWAGSKTLMLHGYFGKPWADETVIGFAVNPDAHTLSVEPKPRYGFGKNLPYYAFNLIEELDTPGEWFLDRPSGTLYFWPPAPLENARVRVSILQQPLIEMKDVSHLVFENLIFEANRTDGVVIRNSSNIAIRNCRVRNVGLYGIRIEGGQNNRVSSCELSDCGAGGVLLSGGDRATLKPSRHTVENCDIHDFSRRVRTYTPGVDLVGVGQIVRNNRIHQAPHFALRYRGNNHLIEYNDIHDVCREVSDAGALYAGRDWGSYGNIVRYNFLHDIRSAVYESAEVHGVYLDDCDSGHLVFGNLFCRIQGMAVLIGGGRDNRIENNIFVECKSAVHIDQRGSKLVTQGGNTGWTSTDLLARIEQYRYTQPPWSVQYPKLAAILKDGLEEAKRPWGNEVLRNLGYRVPRWAHDLGNGYETSTYLIQQDNLPDADPLFVNPDQGDYRLRPESPALKIPGFQPIPIEKIGPTGGPEKP
jgi:hypothetical protein